MSQLKAGAKNTKEAEGCVAEFLMCRWRSAGFEKLRRQVVGDKEKQTAKKN
jgi:hypothetical protein